MEFTDFFLVQSVRIINNKDTSKCIIKLRRNSIILEVII